MFTHYTTKQRSGCSVTQCISVALITKYRLLSSVGYEQQVLKSLHQHKFKHHKHYYSLLILNGWLGAQLGVTGQHIMTALDL